MKSAYNAFSSEVMKIRQDIQGVSSIKEPIFARFLLNWKRAYVCMCLCVCVHISSGNARMCPPYSMCGSTPASPTTDPSSVATMHFSTPCCTTLVIMGDIDLW